MEPYTKREPGESRRMVLEFARGRILAGDPPTVREVQDELGFRSLRTAKYHLDHLVEDGLLTHKGGRSRGWALPSAKGPGGEVS